VSVEAILIALLTGLLANEFCDLAVWCAHKLVRWSASHRYTDPGRAEIRAEELAALIDERPGNIFKLMTALSFAGCAVTVSARRSLAPRWRPARKITQGVMLNLVYAGVMHWFIFLGCASAAISAHNWLYTTLVVIIGVPYMALRGGSERVLRRLGASIREGDRHPGDGISNRESASS
jgi:hypothetical protein